MKVKTLRAHNNLQGVHKEGDVYLSPYPVAAIKFGYVEEVGDAERTVESLKSEAEDRNIDLPEKGSGKKGAVVKADILKAVKNA